jgi:hypothetical protein
VQVAVDAAELRAGLGHASGAPAHCHGAVAPVLDVARVSSANGDQRLDRVGRAEGPGQRRVLTAKCRSRTRPPPTPSPTRPTPPPVRSWSTLPLPSAAGDVDASARTVADPGGRRPLVRQGQLHRLRRLRRRRRGAPGRARAGLRPHPTRQRTPPLACRPPAGPRPESGLLNRVASSPGHCRTEPAPATLPWVHDAVDDPVPPEDPRIGPGHEETPAVPDAAVIRRALAECMTLADIDDAMGWAPGTARQRRWRTERASRR